MFNLRISPLLSCALLTCLCLLPGYSFASTVTYFVGKDSVRYATETLACKSHSSSYIIRGANSAGTGFYCGTTTQTVWTLFRNTQNCPLGHTGLHCNSQLPACPYGTFDPVLNSCPIPPWDNCPAGSSWDYFAEPPRCTFPQDDACGSIGAAWNPAASSCQCPSGSLLVSAAGVSRCMPSGDDSCSSSSPDFKGYGPSGQPVCTGSGRCPGGTPGYIGDGDQLTFVCVPPVDDNDSSCNGTRGLFNGVSVCIPKPGTDPDLPGCKGVVGTVGNDKVCIEPANNDSRCKPGETAGYVGSGSNMTFTCVPKNYGPQTCPPGQYVINMATQGFGCAKASNDPPSGNSVGSSGKPAGVVTGSSTSTTKDGDGNVKETTTADINLKIDGLFHDAPNDNYQSELEAFGKDALDGIDVTAITSEFSGRDGAFTDRNSLDAVSSFVKSHTIGNSANCSGTFPFLGYTVSCAKFAKYNQVIGWFIAILTVISIYNTLMRKSESGV